MDMHSIPAFLPAFIGLIYLFVLAAAIAAVVVTIKTLGRIAAAQERAAGHLEEIAERLHDRPL